MKVEFNEMMKKQEKIMALIRLSNHTHHQQQGQQQSTQHHNNSSSPHHNILRPMAKKQAGSKKSFDHITRRAFEFV